MARVANPRSSPSHNVVMNLIGVSTLLGFPVGMPEEPRPAEPEIYVLSRVMEILGGKNAKEVKS